MTTHTTLKYSVMQKEKGKKGKGKQKEKERENAQMKMKEEGKHIREKIRVRPEQQKIEGL
jgi:hypothetical protein